MDATLAGGKRACETETGVRCFVLHPGGAGRAYRAGAAAPPSTIKLHSSSPSHLPSPPPQPNHLLTANLPQAQSPSDSPDLVHSSRLPSTADATPHPQLLCSAPPLPAASTTAFATASRTSIPTQQWSSVRTSPSLCPTPPQPNRPHPSLLSRSAMTARASPPRSPPARASRSCCTAPL